MHRKLFGTFTERGTQLEIVRLDPDASLTLGAANVEFLVFVLRGTICCGRDRLKPYSAARIAPGETATFSGAEAMEAFVISLPRIPHLTQSSPTAALAEA